MVEGNDARPRKEAPGILTNSPAPDGSDNWRHIGDIAEELLARISPEPPDKTA